MSDFPADIYSEPEDVDPDTLAHLGPLTRLAGVWEGRKGVDLNPKAEGPERREFLERIEMQPIDPQANGPQLLYGLRYHVHIVASDEESTFHDQIGYWLWEPATGLIKSGGPPAGKKERRRRTRRETGGTVVMTKPATGPAWAGVPPEEGPQCAIRTQSRIGEL